MNFSILDGREEFIPKLRGNKTWYSVYDHKKLFDLGIDLEDLKKTEPVLENMKYYPLPSSWTFYGFITGACIMKIALVTICICCFKGKLSIKNEKPSKRTSSLKRQRINIEHLVLKNRYPEVRNVKMEKMHEIFCNPTLEPQGNIILDEVRALPPVPPRSLVQGKGETYMDPTPEKEVEIENITQAISPMSRKPEKKEKIKITPLRVKW